MYLAENFEFVNNMPSEFISEVTIERSSYHGNTNKEYVFKTPLVINKWRLHSICINRQWNESHLNKLMVSQPLMPLIDLRESLNLSRYTQGIKWLNNTNTEFGLDSQILRKAIAFIESIPQELKTVDGVKLYYKGLNCINLKGLADFYHKFINCRNDISLSDKIFLETFFVEKMDFLIS